MIPADLSAERARVLKLLDAYQAAAGVLRLKKWFDEDSEGDHAVLAQAREDLVKAFGEVERLTAERNQAVGNYDAALDNTEAALAENERMRSALEVYAAAEMWQFIGPPGEEKLTRVNNDLARNALASAPEERP